MRAFIITTFVFATTITFAQSKKELQGQVAKLKTEVNQLKAENEELKKPKDIQLNDEQSKVSYAIGSLMATNIKSQGGMDSLNLEALNAGFKDAYSGDSAKMDQQQSMMTYQEYMQKQMEKKVGKMREANKAFFAQNAQKPNVKQTASGLQYEVVSAGKGKTPKATDQVTVHYTGKLLDGTVFDSSTERGSPATFGVNQVIAGWTEALQLMKEGDKWILYIPDHLGYGERGAGGQIPPFAALVFEVELIKVN